MWRIPVIGLVAVAALMPNLADAAATPAPIVAEPVDSDDVPLVPLPEGCDQPVLPHVVFTGEAIDKDDRTVRYRVDRIRAGEIEPFGVDDVVDIRYGLDAQYIEVGETYLVSAMVEPILGFLISYADDPIEHFGGDQVIGISETDLKCPSMGNMAITLWPDGSSLETGALKPLSEARPQLIAAVAVPILVALGAIFVLAALRLGLWGAARMIRQ